MTTLNTVFDASALLALAGGNRKASRLIVRAERDPDRRLWVPTLSLLRADRKRPGIAAFIGSHQVLHTIGLDFSTVLAVSGAPDSEEVPVIRCAAEPNIERPYGAMVATQEPALYGPGFWIADLNEEKP